jgi:ABC-type branched-subunit amino acid transport system ATPase component
MSGETGPGALALCDVTREFSGVRAVAGVSLAVAPGEVAGLIGPNGSGKTTLVNVATGAVSPSAGRVVVDGADLTGRPSGRFARAGVVRSFQGLRLFEGLDALDNVLLGAQRGVGPSLAAAWLRTPAFSRRERELAQRARAALDEVGMSAFAHRPVGALSHGQRRRVELARAFAARPRYLVLDEPGAGVDPEHLARLAEVIGRRRDEGVGVLLVEHDLGLVERVCDRVAGMVDGAVVAVGPFPTVAAHPALASHLQPVAR